MEAFNAAMEGTRTILAQVEKPGGTMYSPERCAELGYDVALFGLTLLSASAAGVERTLSVMGAGDHPTAVQGIKPCLLYTSPSPRDKRQSRMPSSA